MNAELRTLRPRQRCVINGHVCEVVRQARRTTYVQILDDESLGRCVVQLDKKMPVGEPRMVRLLTVSELVEQIEAHGYSVRFVDFCEDARTPGLLGQIAGVTDRERREVKVRLKGRTADELVETLEHELRHVEDPDWDCGNRDVLGRGPSGSAA